MATPGFAMLTDMEVMMHYWNGVAGAGVWQPRHGVGARLEVFSPALSCVFENLIFIINVLF